MTPHLQRTLVAPVRQRALPLRPRMLFKLFPALTAVSALGCGAAGVDETVLLSPEVDYSTIAESSAWRATSTHAQVVSLVQRLAADSSRIHVESSGTTMEGRDLPLLVIADPPVSSPADVGDRMVVFAWGGIHSGEVCGKPATLMLARELATVPDPELLEDLVVLLLPLLNADGNDRMSPDNRPGQAGPVEGMGTRPNAQGLNINRDFTKLETQEARALTGILNRWDPAVAMDLHTTNGTIHQYVLTYDGPRHPDVDEELRGHASEVMLPAINASMLAETSYRTFSYGNLNRDRTEWRTYPAQPRYSTHYLGLRNVFGVLSEAYSYASYEDRVRATLAFVRHTFRYAAENKHLLEGIRERAAARTIQRGAAPGSNDSVTLAQRSRLREREDTLLGYEGRRWSERGEKMTFTVRKDDTSVPTESARLPWAYVLSRRVPSEIIETLGAHGIQMDLVKEETSAVVSAYRIKNVTAAQREYEGHNLLDFDVDAESVTWNIPRGSIVVRTGQALGALAAHLLEPRAEDGLGTWGFFGSTFDTGSPSDRTPPSFDVYEVGASGLSSGPALPKPTHFAAARLLTPIDLPLGE